MNDFQKRLYTLRRKIAQNVGRDAYYDSGNSLPGHPDRGVNPGDSGQWPANSALPSENTLHERVTKRRKSYQSPVEADPLVRHDGPQSEQASVSMGEPGQIVGGDGPVITLPE